MKKELVVFDVCNTLINGDSTQLYIDFLQQHGYETFSHLQLFENKIFKLIIGGFKRIFHYDFARKYMISCFKGIPDRKLQEEQAAFNEIYFKKLNQKLLQIFINYKETGSDILLLSASINPPIDALAQHLGVPSYSTKLEIKNDIYTGKVKYDLLEKKETVFMNGDCPIEKYKRVIFYTDNIEDIGLIQFLQNNIQDSQFFIIIIDTKRESLWQKNLDKYTIKHYEFIR